MKWNEMQPDDRDVLVHEKVMGKTDPEICDFDPKMTVMTTGDDPTSFDWHCYKCGAHGKVTRNGYYQHPKAIPHYTTSMDVAWKIVEKMKKGNWGKFCRELDNVLTHNKWDRANNKPYVTWFEQFLWSFNVEAVCLAALRTVGEEVEQ